MINPEKVKKKVKFKLNPNKYPNKYNCKICGDLVTSGLHLKGMCEDCYSHAQDLPNVKEVQNKEIMHTICIDDFMTLQLNMPEKMTITEFLGILMKANDMIKISGLKVQVEKQIRHDWTKSEKAKLMKIGSNIQARHDYAEELGVTCKVVDTMYSYLRLHT